MRGKRARAAAIWAYLCGAMLVGSFAFPSPARAEEPVPPAVTAPSAILVDATTGRVLFQKNAHEKRAMASVTKLMTLMLALKAVARGQVRVSDWVPVSMEAYRTQGSQIWLEPGEHLSLNQMLTAIAVGSANDASVAVGEFLAGSTAAFVARMNREAVALGLRDTHFANPHGLPALQHYSTASDLAGLAMAAVRTPRLLGYTSRLEDRTIRNGKGGSLWLLNQNRLLRTYAGTDGLKTGYTRAAGFCLVATTRRGDTRLIAVVLGDATSKARFDDATSLLNWGFAHFRTAFPVAPGKPLSPVPVRHGELPRVPVRPVRPVAVTLRRDRTEPLTTEIRLPASVTAPVQRGQVLGELVVRQSGHVLVRVPLEASRSVRSVAFTGLVWRYFLRLVG